MTNHGKPNTIAFAGGMLWSQLYLCGQFYFTTHRMINYCEQSLPPLLASSQSVQFKLAHLARACSDPQQLSAVAPEPEAPLERFHKSDDLTAVHRFT